MSVCICLLIQRVICVCLCTEYKRPSAHISNLTPILPYLWVLTHPVLCLYLCTEYKGPSAHLCNLPHVNPLPPDSHLLENLLPLTPSLREPYPRVPHSPFNHPHSVSPTTLLSSTIKSTPKYFLIHLPSPHTLPHTYSRETV